MKYLFWFILIILFLNACSEKLGFRTMPISQEESKTLDENPFPEENTTPESTDSTAENRERTGIDDNLDALIPNIFKDANISKPQFITRCSQDKYEEELALALEEAKADRDKKTVVIKYAISVSRANHSLLSYCTHQRSILRRDASPELIVHTELVRIPSTFSFKRVNYLLDIQKARKEFINGKKCFFNTAKIKTREEPITGNNDRLQIYQSYCRSFLSETTYGPYNIKEIDYTDTEKEDLVLPVYLADFPASSSINDVTILNKNFTIHSSRERREYSIESLKQVFDFKTIWTFREELTDSLSTDRSLNYSYRISLPTPGYEAMPQLIDWIIFSGLGATATDRMFSPLVLDLGKKHIKTSSLKWGTFFDLSGLGEKLLGKDKTISHLTAWVGGDLVPGKANSVTNQVLKREAEDGFLVIPSSNGKVESGKNLFGNLTELNGKTGFSNGFEALSYFANKNCNSSDIRKRYVGKWDGELYSNILKVWIDRNRNGVSEPEEIKNLPELGIAAINTCYYLHEQREDRFGNFTAHRAAFLLVNPKDPVLNNDDKIISILKSGYKEDGTPADFRAIIDIFFQVNTEIYLENLSELTN